MKSNRLFLTMTGRWTFLILLMSSLLLLPACGDREPAESGINEIENEEEVGVIGEDGVIGEEQGDIAGGEVSLQIAEQEPYGQYLADGEGRALYMFTADTQGQSSDCYDDCADAWPPLITSSAPTANNLDQGLIGTVTRSDGSQQVTYNGWPLYYYREDTGNNVTGQDIQSFGGEWYLVNPQGEKIEATEGGGGS